MTLQQIYVYIYLLWDWSNNAGEYIQFMTYRLSCLSLNNYNNFGTSVYIEMILDHSLEATKYNT